jgi:hypothetical protein
LTWLDELTLETVIVHTTEGLSFKGLKSSVYDDCIVLSHARLLQDDGITSLLEGEVPIPREKVHFLQILPGGA